VLLGLMAYGSLRLAWADHLSLSVQLASRVRAVELAPEMAIFYQRLADKREELGLDFLPALGAAVSHDPENAGLRMRLGLQAELAGNFPLAESSLLAAASRSTLYQPRYSLAQYYFRRQNADKFWKWSRSAFEIAPGDVGALLDLGWDLRADSQWIWREVIPPRPQIARQYLMFLAGKEQWETAAEVAASLSESSTLADLPVLADYCERRLKSGNGPGALTVWNTLCRRGLLPYTPLDTVAGPTLTNNNFDYAPSQAGFNWRLNNPPGVILALRHHEIQLDFWGSQPEQCTILWQYVPVQPGAHYRFRFVVRAADPAGIGWSVADLKGDEAGSSLASSGSLEFPAAQNSVMKLALVYRRPLGSVRLRGSVAITSLTMDRLQ
jgi:hypothetical protein